MSKEISLEELQSIIAGDIEADDIEVSNIKVETVEEKRRDLGLPPIFTEISASLYGLNEHDSNYSEELVSRIVGMENVLRRHEEIRLVSNNEEGIIGAAKVRELMDGFEIDDFELKNLLTSYPSERNFKLLPKISSLIGARELSDTDILQEVSKNSVYFISAIEELLTILQQEDENGVSKVSELTYLSDSFKGRPHSIMSNEGMVFNVYSATIEQVKEFCIKHEITTPEMTLLFDLLTLTGNTHTTISGVLSNIAKMIDDTNHNLQVIKENISSAIEGEESITYFNNRMVLISGVQDYVVLHKLFVENDVCELASVVFNDQF